MVTVTLENVRRLLADRDTSPILITPDYEPMPGRKYSLWREFFSPEPMYWFVQQEIQVRLSNGQEITIPKGFRTDLSSSPQQLWAIVPPYGDFLFAALVHDYLYKYNIISQAFADREMLIWSMVICDDYKDNIRRYKAVVARGGSWWERSRRRLEQEKAGATTPA